MTHLGASKLEVTKSSYSSSQTSDSCLFFNDAIFRHFSDPVFLSYLIHASFCGCHGYAQGIRILCTFDTDPLKLRSTSCVLFVGILSIVKSKIFHSVLLTVDKERWQNVFLKKYFWYNTATTHSHWWEAIFTVAQSIGCVTQFLSL